VGQTIAERAAGTPFFAEEIVRELAERGVLRGKPGGYVSTTEAAEVSVPATLQATIAARIDRLDPQAKHTLSAAAVIGTRFTTELITALGVQPVVGDLVAAQLIDQVRFTRQLEYAFHHPMIRAVAYESQLKSTRTELHRRVATAIEQRKPDSADENAALIAEHLEAAGELDAAFGWHMRAGAWAVNRDLAAAWMSWERARRVADSLPADYPDRAAMRIASRTMLCGIAWRVHMDVAGDRFEELRELCIATGDKASLAIGTAVLVIDHVYHARLREASHLAPEAMALIESVGDPALTVGLSAAPIRAKLENAEFCDALRWSERVIDLAEGDPSKGNFVIGSPLALAFATRALTRYFLGCDGWQDDLRHAVTMAHSADPMTYATVVGYVYMLGIPYGVLTPDDRALREIEDALHDAERSGDDFAFAVTRLTLGCALVHRQTAAERDRGQKLMAEVSEAFVRERHNLSELPFVEVYLARESARRGDRDGAIQRTRAALDQLIYEGRLLSWGLPATAVLVEALLDRGTDGDWAEAEVAIERLAAAPTDDRLVMREIWLLRMHALSARAHGDEASYRDYRDRYRAMARSLGFEGHMTWAEAMP